MDALPCVAQFRQMSRQISRDAANVVSPKIVIFPEFGRAIRAMQVEHSFFPSADNVDMRRSMIVRIDCHSQPTETQNCRHVAP
jgi:hypothetical protein